MVGCQSLSDLPCKACGSSVTSAGHGAIPCQAGEAMHLKFASYNDRVADEVEKDKDN